MRALVILNGEISDLKILKEIGKEYDFILCADGAIEYCLKASIIPHMLIGDLDSISEYNLRLAKDNNIPIKRFPVKKDETDSELAINYLMERGYTDITIIGAMGNRMDHTLANIFLLNKIHEKGIKGKIIDKNNTIYLVQDELVLDRKENYFISLIPITEYGVIVTLKGFEYELNKSKINFGTTYGVSNRITEDKGYVTVHSGKCFVFVSKD
ncbi:MAG: thiamine diphosphokinase [Tissierellia bacterium]|nr:thiamine diphosphokinase [Tissierellia bacterium]